MLIFSIGLVIFIIWQYLSKIALYREYCIKLSEQKKYLNEISELKNQVKRLKSRIQYIKTYGNDFHSE